MRGAWETGLEMTPPSPYRGIHPFRYADRDLFFGRGEAVGELFARILVSRLVLLFGESQTGKSSLINAGLVPALAQENMAAERLRVQPRSDAPILVERIPRGTTEEEGFLPSIFSEIGKGAADRVIPCPLEDFSNAVWEQPRPGRPFFYLVQQDDGTTSTYGAPTAAKPRAPGPGTCLPE